MKFVVRFLTAEDVMLGWAEVHADPSPGGFFVPVTEFDVEAPGTGAKLSVHWCDVDCARVEPLTALMAFEPEHVGKRAIFRWFNPLWRIVDDPTAPRTPVTVRTNQTVSPGPASMGAHDPRTLVN